jgi:hypothetical protein
MSGIPDAGAWFCAARTTRREVPIDKYREDRDWILKEIDGKRSCGGGPDGLLATKHAS